MRSSKGGWRVTPSDLPFEEIWLYDFEFIARPGEHRDVVCLVAHELRSGRWIRLWRDQLGEQPPYRTDRDALLVNFVANAEWVAGTTKGYYGTEIIISPLAKGNAYSNDIYYTHSSDLRTLQEIFGLGPSYLGGAANAHDLSDLFMAGVIPPSLPAYVIFR
jgi:hypothetical protein